MPDKKKYPCGGCSKEVVKNAKSVTCCVCEFWFHNACIEGMTDQFYESIAYAHKTWGYSAYFCKCCVKAMAKLNQSVVEMKSAIGKLEERIEVLEGEKEAVAKRVKTVKRRAEKVKEDLDGVEREMVSGMEKAMANAKKELKVQLEKDEERNVQVVLYGIVESKKEAVEERINEEMAMVTEMTEVLGVELKGEVEIRYRAGREVPKEGERPRPLIVKVQDDETRTKIMANSGKLARVEKWKRVFVAPDLSPEQRKQDREEEMARKDDAERRTKEAKDEGRNVKFIVVGKRGSRRIIEVQEREQDI